MWTPPKRTAWSRSTAPRAVNASGARLDATGRTVLVEGAGLAGYRAICIAAVRDGEIIKRLKEVEAEGRRRVEADLGHGDFELMFYNYGIDGAMGEHEPRRNLPPTAYEVGVVIEVVAATQELATDICQRVYATTHMVMYPGRVTGEGNFASPFAPDVLDVGPVYRYTINHVLPVDDPCALFPVRTYQVNGDRWEECRG